MTDNMPTALVVSDSRTIGRTWVRALAAAGWRALHDRSITSIAAARQLGVDVVVFDAETPRALAQLADLVTVVEVPPILIRASMLACHDHLRGYWRAALHRGPIDAATLVRTAAMLRLAGRTEPTALPVQLPLEPVTKWSARVW